MGMNRIIAEHWNKETHELPGFNCIVYPGGGVTILVTVCRITTQKYANFFAAPAAIRP
jgi:hypothetical protein